MKGETSNFHKFFRIRKELTLALQEHTATASCRCALNYWRLLPYETWRIDQSNKSVFIEMELCICLQHSGMNYFPSLWRRWESSDSIWMFLHIFLSNSITKALHNPQSNKKIWGLKLWIFAISDISKNGVQTQKRAKKANANFAPSFAKKKRMGKAGEKGVNRWDLRSGNHIFVISPAQ